MKYIEDIIKGISFVGGIAGLLTLSWKIFEEYQSYLKIRIQVTNGDFPTVLTEIENVNRLKHKKILNAFLIVSKEYDNLLLVGQTLGQNLDEKIEINVLDDFQFLSNNSPIYINKIAAFIPIPFYYIENTVIGDEKLTYECSIDKGLLEKGQYSVRFYVCGEKKYSRITQNILIIN